MFELFPLSCPGPPNRLVLGAAVWPCPPNRLLLGAAVCGVAAPKSEGFVAAGGEADGTVVCGPKRFLPWPNIFAPDAGADIFVAPVLAPRPLFSFGGSPAGVVEPNGKSVVLGAAGVVDPKEGSVEVPEEGGAAVEAGGAPKLKAGVLDVVAALELPKPPKSDGSLPFDVVLLAVLFPKPAKPPAFPLVPNNDGAAVPVEFAVLLVPNNDGVAVPVDFAAPPKVNGLEGSAML